MVRSTMETSSGPDADDVRNELKGDAQRLKNTAQQQGKEKAREEKERVAKSAKSASSAIDAAADKLREDENAPSWMVSAFSSAARQVDDLAGRLQDTSPRELARETNRFGRENPAAFLAASAAVGFAAARFLRAGAEYDDNHEDGSDSAGDRRKFSDSSMSGQAGFRASPPPVPRADTPGSPRATSFTRPGEAL